MSSDESLLAQWRAGDKHAGNQLFERHFGGVRRFFANKIHDPQDAEDLVQRTFIACVEGRDRFEGRASFRSFLLGIAHKQCLKYWSRKRVDKRTDAIEDHAITSFSDRPSSVMARNANERMLLEALRSIPMRDQALIELYYWEDLSGREIAEVLGLPEDTVRSVLRRAKTKLAKQMRRMQHVLGVPESTDEDLEAWAKGIRTQLGATGS